MPFVKQQMVQSMYLSYQYIFDLKQHTGNTFALCCPA